MAGMEWNRERATGHFGIGILCRNTNQRFYQRCIPHLSRKAGMGMVAVCRNHHRWKHPHEDGGLIMKERGMIFNAEMVRAILDGRKMQTRRIVKSDCMDIGEKDDGTLWPWREHDNGGDYWYSCPFGEVGDRIWVREAFQGPLVSEELLEEYRAYPEKFENPEYCEYAADGGPRPEYCDLDDNLRHGWRPSIHMPRWASRITLEITGVRVERLQNISDEDVDAEGFAGDYPTSALPALFPGEPSDWSHLSMQDCYGVLWKSIYGEESWQVNPWVWVITFQRVEGGAA